MSSKQIPTNQKTGQSKTNTEVTPKRSPKECKKSESTSKLAKEKTEVKVEE